MLSKMAEGNSWCINRVQRSGTGQLKGLETRSVPAQHRERRVRFRAEGSGDSKAGWAGHRVSSITVADSELVLWVVAIPGLTDGLLGQDSARSLWWPLRITVWHDAGDTLENPTNTAHTRRTVPPGVVRQGGLVLRGVRGRTVQREALGDIIRPDWGWHEGQVESSRSPNCCQRKMNPDSGLRAGGKV